MRHSIGALRDLTSLNALTFSILLGNFKFRKPFHSLAVLIGGNTHFKATLSAMWSMVSFVSLFP